MWARIFPPLAKQRLKRIEYHNQVFCEKIGAPVNIISEWESGKTKSYRNYVHATAMAYNVSVAWLKGETDQKTAAPAGSEDLSEEQIRIIEKIKALNAEDFSKVSNALEALLNIKL